VLLWVTENREGFSDQYARARQAQAFGLADEILEIADDGSNDTYATDSGEMTNYDVIARSRLRVDTRKWYLARVLPKLFGDKQQVEHSGPEGGPMEVRTVRLPAVEIDTEKWAGRFRSEPAAKGGNGNGNGRR
jgi:hypothetical protein